MKLSLTVALPLLLVPSHAGDELSFHPATDSEIAKRLSIDLDARFVDAHVTLNGEELPPEAMEGSGMDPTTARMSVSVTDKYVASRDGRPLDLLRTYREMSLTSDSGEEHDSVDEFEALEGKTVRFKWNEDSDDYDKSFHESEGDAALLEGLWDDMDLRVLLPERSVANGDTWQVTGEKLGPLFIPGGLVGSADGDAEFAQVKDWMDTQLGDLARNFTVSCKCKGEREADGAKVREIAFTLEGRGTIDVAALLAKAIEDADEMPEHTLDASADLTVTGEGTLLWDAGAGRMHSFTMKSDATAGVKMDMSFEVEGETYEVTMTGRAECNLAWELATEKP